LFTRDSRKLRLATLALCAGLLTYLGINASLTALAHGLEARGEAYPYKSEDWLRYLLPAYFGDDPRPRMMLTGPSTARENFLVEMFVDEFPDHRIFQGGLSLGTLEDVVTSLDYIERVYGANALPGVLVLGLSPRFVAEIPDERPFADGIDRYSRHFRTEHEGDEIRLVAKSRREGLRAEFKFRTQKQTPRYQVALLWLIREVLPEALDDALRNPALTRLAARSNVAGLFDIDRLLQRGLRSRIAELISPYKYRGVRTADLDELTGWLDDPKSWWRDVFDWDPSTNADVIRARFDGLLQLTRRHDIRLFAVNLPEREVGRVRYSAAHYARYEQLIRDALGDIPLLDLRLALEDREFHDSEHANQEGGVRMTSMVFDFMHESGQ
jgi:hypothetical protein